ncbi:hypothetical protein PR202_ga04012 [Eleusine coracana subsp. coracana]|uniref:Uncharacterized protein n=1 Tax=Eleusine coracana subsp. coracana TaxID=191504 RepID=A0AAV5BQK5_ELECO|nr:hypothetical protein PR202_ga04012 [Eleusine coracana subsp. coracana]
MATLAPPHAAPPSLLLTPLSLCSGSELNGGHPRSLAAVAMAAPFAGARVRPSHARLHRGPPPWCPGGSADAHEVAKDRAWRRWCERPATTAATQSQKADDGSSGALVRRAYAARLFPVPRDARGTSSAAGGRRTSTSTHGGSCHDRATT